MLHSLRCRFRSPRASACESQSSPSPPNAPSSSCKSFCWTTSSTSSVVRMKCLNWLLKPAIFREVMPQRRNEIDNISVSSLAQASLIHSTTLVEDFTFLAAVNDFGACMFGIIYFVLTKLIVTYGCDFIVKWLVYWCYLMVYMYLCKKIINFKIHL